MSEDQGKAGGNSAADGAAADSAGAKTKRKPRTPEEILKDIEADEKEAIRRVQERAAKQKAEVQKKLGAAAKKAAAVEMVDGFRAAVKEVLKKPDLSDADADEAIKKIISEGLTKLASEAATAAAPAAAAAANAAPITLAA